MAAAQAADPTIATIAAAGDIACDPTDPFFNGGNGTATNCRMRATSDLILKGGFDAVLLLGDNQYWDGTLAAHLASFAPTWGRLGPLLRPAPGNHEYQTPGAAGYFDYFGPAAGDRTKGWYSYDLGSWHIVVLNSNCSNLGANIGANNGCGPGSPQLQWLTADLAAHPRACTLAYWHHPRFSSGAHGNDATYDTFWRELYKAGADVVLVGHDHDYERFAPQDPDAKADPSYGIRQFVVGTGGRETRAFATIRANSESRSHNDLGVLKLVLRPDGYDWEFLPVPGGTFNDQGSASCHNAPDTASLFLHKGRFKAEVAWKGVNNKPFPGKAAAPATDSSGVFSFANPDSWELLVKVVNACTRNRQFWVFSSSTSSQEYTLTITDTQTGEVKRYDSPPGRQLPLVDLKAFSCP